MRTKAVPTRRVLANCPDAGGRRCRSANRADQRKDGTFDFIEQLHAQRPYLARQFHNVPLHCLSRISIDKLDYRAEDFLRAGLRDVVEALGGTTAHRAGRSLLLALRFGAAGRHFDSAGESATVSTAPKSACWTTWTRGSPGRRAEQAVNDAALWLDSLDRERPIKAERDSR